MNVILTALELPSNKNYLQYFKIIMTAPGIVKCMLGILYCYFTAYKCEGAYLHCTSSVCLEL